MTEQQIRDGYDRLDGALAPPSDADERVARRVRVRRRRRRAALVTGTAVVLVAGIGTAVVASGGDDSTDGLAVDQPSGPSSTLVLTRPDGSTFAFPDVTVTCRPPAGDEQGPGQRIWAVSPRHIEGKRVTEPFVYFRGIVDKVGGDRTFTFPNDWSMDTTDTPVILFVADSRGEPRGNEVSSAEAGAAGTVRVLEASCDPTPVLRLEVDMTLGSEVEQGTLDVAGDLG